VEEDGAGVSWPGPKVTCSSCSAQAIRRIGDFRGQGSRTSQRGGQIGGRRAVAALPGAVAQAHQIGVAALGDIVVKPEGTGAVMDPAHHRPLRCDQGLQLEGEVVEEAGRFLPIGALVGAQVGEQADPFLKAEIQPGTQPHPQHQTCREFAEVLGIGAEIGHLAGAEGTGVTAAALGPGPVVEPVDIQIEGKGARLQQAALHPQAGQVFRPEHPLKDERLAEIGMETLATPGGEGPGVGMPLRRRGHLLGAADRLRWGQGDRWGGLQIKILFGAVQIEDSVDIPYLTDAFDQAVAQPAGLQVLLTPLELDAAGGVDGARTGVEFNAIGHHPAPGHGDHHVPGGHEAASLAVVALAVGGELQLQGRRRRRRQGPLRQRRGGGLLGGWGGIEVVPCSGGNPGDSEDQGSRGSSGREASEARLLR
jgi:hypothetical protein